MNTCKTCPGCNGQGYINEIVCISEGEPPTRHDRFDELCEVVRDAVKAKDDHKRLCEMNLRARESYDRQLTETLGKLETSAMEILKS